MPPADDVKSRGGRGGGRRGGVGARGSGRGSIHQHMVNGRGPAGMGAHTGIVPRPAVASPFVMGQMLQQRATPSGVPGTPMQMVGVHTGQAQALSMPPGGSVAGVSMQAQQQQQPPTMSMGGPGTQSNGLGMGVNVGVVTGAGSPPLPQQPPLPPTQQQQGQQIQQYPPPPRGPPLRTPSGGGLPRPGTGTSATYAQAKHAQLTLKDLEKARVLMEAEIDADGECAQSALKDLVCILKQMGQHTEATNAILTYRAKWPDDDRMQESLDNMLLDLFKHARNLEGQIVVTGRLIAHSQKALAEGRTGWMIRTGGCKNTVSVHRRLSTLHRLRGQAQMQAGRWREAEESLVKALEHDRLHVKEEDLSINIDRAACLIATGRLVEAQDLLLHVAATASLVIETPHKGVGGSSVGTVRRVGLALKALIDLLEGFAVEVRKVADELERTASVVNALDSDLLGELQLGESGGSASWSGATSSITESQRPRRTTSNGGTRGQRREGDSLWIDQVLTPAIEYFWHHGPSARMDVLGLQNKSGIGGPVMAAALTSALGAKGATSQPPPPPGQPPGPPMPPVGAQMSAPLGVHMAAVPGVNGTSQQQLPPQSSTPSAAGGQQAQMTSRVQSLVVTQTSMAQQAMSALPARLVQLTDQEQLQQQQHIMQQMQQLQVTDQQQQNQQQSDPVAQPPHSTSSTSTATPSTEMAVPEIQQPNHETMVSAAGGSQTSQPKTQAVKIATVSIPPMPKVPAPISMTHMGPAGEVQAEDMPPPPPPLQQMAIEEQLKHLPVEQQKMIVEQQMLPSMQALPSQQQVQQAPPAVTAQITAANTVATLLQ